jgi:hypothetical protein
MYACFRKINEERREKQRAYVRVCVHAGSVFSAMGALEHVLAVRWGEGRPKGTKHI